MNKSLILNKIKVANNLATDTELARYLGISKFTLSNWRGRDTLDWELVLSKCEQLDLNWLIKEDVEQPVPISQIEEVTSPEQEESNILDFEKRTIDLVLEKYKELAIEYGSLKKNQEISSKKLLKSGRSK